MFGPWITTKSTGLSLGQLTGVFACVLVRTSLHRAVYSSGSHVSIAVFRSLGDLSAKLSSVKTNRDASPTSSFSSEPTGSKRPLSAP